MPEAILPPCDAGSDDGAVPSPCRGTCGIDAASGLCRGCARTLDEIIGWPHASAAQKRAIWQALACRGAMSMEP